MSITNVITRITVDMAGDVKRFAVKAKQYDRATRVIVVSLLWDEVPYVLDSADTVRCNVHKPDGTIAIIEGDNIAVNGNTVTITLPGTALTAAGRAWADIEIETQDEGQQVSCQCFEIDIAKSPVDDDSIISTNEFSAMKLATKAANDAAAAATAEIEATAAAGTAASQAAAAAQAATDAANQAAAAATASIQIDPTLTDNSKAAPAGMVGEIKEDLSAMSTASASDVGKALKVKTVTDGKVTEWEFGEAGGGGLTQSQKLAILNCFQHVAWTDAQGQTYYDELEDVLFPPAELTSISATYVNSNPVYADTDIDTLKQYITVTAHYSDGTTSVVNAYTLSGTLTVGTSILTVTYSEMTTTISVTVSETPTSDMTQWSDGVAYTDIEVISDSYYNERGNITPYSGWSRTGKVPIHGAVSVTFEGHGTGNAGVAGIYCWWFKEDGTPLSNFGDGLKAYEPTTKQVPSEAYYFGISGSNAQINGVILNGITPYGA